eukprot:753541-Hanusia_phi.AAC.6
MQREGWTCTFDSHQVWPNGPFSQGLTSPPRFFPRDKERSKSMVLAAAHSRGISRCPAWRMIDPPLSSQKDGDVKVDPSSLARPSLPLPASNPNVSAVKIAQPASSSVVTPGASAATPQHRPVRLSPLIQLLIKNLQPSTAAPAPTPAAPMQAMRKVRLLLQFCELPDGPRRPEALRTLLDVAT